MRVVVHIDSRDRREGTPASYRLAMPQVFKRVQRYRVLSAELAGTLDQIAGANAELYMGVETGPQTRIAVPDGIYTLATLQSALAGALAQAFPDLEWRVELPPATRRVSISTVEGAVLTVNGGGLARILGLDLGTSGLELAGRRPAALTPYAYVLVESDELRGSFASMTGPSTCLAKILTAAAAEHQPSPWMECLPTLSSLESLHIRTRVYDSQATAMPEHSLSLELELGIGPPPPALPALPPATRSRPSLTPTPTPTLPATATAPPSITAASIVPSPAGTRDGTGLAGGTGGLGGYRTVMKQAGCAAATMAAVWAAFV